MLKKFFQLIAITGFLNSSLALAEKDTIRNDPKSRIKFEEVVSVFHRKDFKRAAPKPSLSKTPLMTLHGGTVLKAASIAAIFWGPSWNDTVFAGDKITGIDSFFAGYSGSSYAATAKEYYDKSGYISTQASYKGYLVDTSAPPSSAASTSMIVNEVCKITNNKPDPNAVYFVFTSTSAGNVNYCAWHSWGKCATGGAPLQVAYMPNIDGVAGCDVKDTVSGHSKGLAALANVTAHELLEAITDPRGAGWFDSTSAENADKCAWVYPNTTGGLSYFPNGTNWKLQMEWSNAAYSKSTGLANLSGQKGCIF